MLNVAPHPNPLFTVYVTTDTPVPAADALNTLPDTPLPLHTPPTGVAVSTTSVSVRHTRSGAFVTMMFAPGVTVIVNVSGVPTHVTPPNTELGVTVIVAVRGNCVALIAVNDAILPTPLAFNPIVGSLFVHVNEVPAVGLVKFTAVVVDPAHKD